MLVLTDKDHVFLLDHLMSYQERILFKALLDNPDDKVLRQEYSDYLKEQGMFASAGLVLNGYIPSVSLRHKSGLGSAPISSCSGSIGGWHNDPITYPVLSGQVLSGQLNPIYASSGFKRHNSIIP